MILSEIRFPCWHEAHEADGMTEKKDKDGQMMCADRVWGGAMGPLNSEEGGALCEVLTIDEADEKIGG